MGYSVVVYFYNPNIYPLDEYKKRLEAQKKLCSSFNVELIEGDYDTEKFYDAAKGLEFEPERGKRCDSCIELRLRSAAKLAKDLEIEYFTSSIVIFECSPFGITDNIDISAFINSTFSNNSQLGKVLIS